MSCLMRLNEITIMTLLLSFGYKSIFRTLVPGCGTDEGNEWYQRRVARTSWQPSSELPENDSLRPEDCFQEKSIIPTLEDIFISVKTSQIYEKTRLPIIIKTWYQLAQDQIWFITDIIPANINTYKKKFTNFHIINTNCSNSHSRESLCCKTAVEFNFFIDSGKRWFCHFDDDNYVNVPRLVEVLGNYDYNQDWYLGRRSITITLYNSEEAPGAYTFWFATFGAGVCLSKSLVLRLVPDAGFGKFLNICNKIEQPDDVTVGYIVEHFAKHRLTELPEFHSHLEQMHHIPAEAFRDQISFSYQGFNVLNVPGFNRSYDPSR